MPKLKTRRGVAKRFKITRKGKVKSKRAGKSHLLTGKSKRRLMSLSKMKTLGKAQAKKIRELLPWG